jgi:hypothetical protein
MQILSLSKLYALVLVLGAVSVVVEAGPTPKKTTASAPAPATNAKPNKSPAKPNTKLTHRVCKARNPISKYKPPKKKTAKSSTTATSNAGKRKRFEVVPRAYTPANPSGKIKLYHGAEKDFGELDFGKSSQAGDFSNGPSFYLTDRERAALQFDCLADAVFFGEPEEIAAAEMHVIEYEWDGTGADIHKFTGLSDPDWEGYQKYVGDCKDKNEKYQKILDSDMVAGPMRKPEDIERKMTSNFWQYVIMNPEAAKKHLKRIGVKKLKCDPQGRSGDFD